MAAPKSSTKAPEQELLARVKEAFGYPLSDATVTDHLLEEWREEAQGCMPDEVFGYFIARSVHWAAEAQAGQRPEQAAREAQCARLERPLPETPLDAEVPEVVARHFCGLLSLRVEHVQRIAEHWLVDVNPRAKDQGPSPIYKWRPTGSPEGAVFDSVAEWTSWRKLVGKLENAEADENRAGVKRLGAELRKTHPRAFAVDFARLSNDGLLGAELRTPVPDATFSDEAGARLWATYRAFLPIGRVLIARAAGERRAKLTAAEVKVCVGLFKAKPNDDWPPALLLGLLAHALSGAKAEASALAKKLLKDKSAVPLTRRWATLVAEQKGPFSS